MKVYLYSRISTDKQTLEQQERTAYEWLNSHNMKVDEVVSDEGISGGVSYSNRKLGLVLIPKLNAGDILIVSEISRLGRSMFDLSKLINTELKERKIRLIIVSMGIDLRCDKMTAIDELILNNFAFAAQLEKQLIHERTLSALQVKKRQGVKLGRANENYKIDSVKQKEGRMKAAKTLNEKTIHSADFQSFCRILKRVFPELQAAPDSWNDKKDEVISNITSEKLIEIGMQMSNARADNPQLFNKIELGFDSYHLNLIRSKIHNTFRSINKFNK